MRKKEEYVNVTEMPKAAAHGRKSMRKKKVCECDRNAEGGCTWTKKYVTKKEYMNVTENGEQRTDGLKG